LPHLFVADLARPEVADADRHHLERVLRVRPGETITVSDGHGGQRTCVFVTGGGLDPIDEVSVAPTRSPSITVGFALVKSEKPEWIVQKLTECGVDRIVPFAADRSIVRWDDDKTARSVERWRRVVVEAAMQSRQRWLPTIEPVGSVADAVAGGAILADASPDAMTPTLDHPFVVIGPEGGWSDGERARADGRFVRFGPSVLRAETAAVAAGVLLSALRERVISPVARRGPRS
jgi:16S rRNA (uracil1498-N3)-methyltransferase